MVILSQAGVRNWVLQRVAALVMLFYFAFLIGYVALQPALTFSVWSGLFHQEWMRLATFFVLFNLCIHAWIGLWTIATDYVKPIFARMLFLILVAAYLSICLLWGVHILWR